jgi:hypothetical protein
VSGWLGQLHDLADDLEELLTEKDGATVKALLAVVEAAQEASRHWHSPAPPPLPERDPLTDVVARLDAALARVEETLNDG